MIGSRKVRDSALRVAPSSAVMAAAMACALCLPHTAGAQGGSGSYHLRNTMNGNARIVSRQARVQLHHASGDSNQRFMFPRVSGNRAGDWGGNAGTITCSSEDGRRVYCDADTRGGVRLVRRISGAACQEGSTWGYNSWVDRGCRAEFEVSGGGSGGNATPNSGTGRTQLKPGWNMFSPQQDVEVGQQVSKEAERQLPMLNDSRVDNYVNNLGQRLSAHAPGYKFAYTYKTVNDRAINAFALPGGRIYINRGVIEAADSEAQLAGVMAHEASHVALRHGTNQASKASAAQMPLAILGGMLGSDSTGAVLAQLGAGFAVNSILLKYSRTAESQADILGSQILYDSGYDARAMAQFFEKIQAQDRGGQPVAFFSSHPSPDRRTDRVNQEVANLGGSQRGYNADSREFNQIKRYVQSLPAPRKPDQGRQLQGDPGRTGSGRQGPGPEEPSDRFVDFENSLLRINHPDNWQAYGQGDAVTIAPRGGLVEDGNGNQALAYGVLVNIYEPRSDRSGQQLQPRDYGEGAGLSLVEATSQLIQEFRLSNRNMRVARSHEGIDVNGERGLSTYLSNDSPIPGGGRETNWLITLLRPEGLLFIVFTAPDRDFQSYESAYQRMLYSVRVRR